jgi:plasmid stabilization system protein ParE
MASGKLYVKWSDEAIQDLKIIYYYLLKKNSKKAALSIRNEIFLTSRSIVFPKQFQVDEIHSKYRRMVIRNYKILYSVDGNIIRIASVINSYLDTSNY